MKISKFFLFLILLILPASCATVREDYPDPENSFASKPGASGPLADLESVFAKQHGSKKSGFLLLENNADSLKWRWPSSMKRGIPWMSNIISGMEMTAAISF